MGKVTFLAAQVPSNPTYNWAFIDATDSFFVLTEK